MSNVIVMDACALLAFINNEDGANKVESILREALKGVQQDVEATY